MDVCLQMLKESNKSKFDSLSVRNSDWSYPRLPSGIFACAYFWQPSQNSCMAVHNNDDNLNNDFLFIIIIIILSIIIISLYKKLTNYNLYLLQKKT